ncbi:multiple PDZ domain protein-like [Oratosquilla oratoria]|uniref:multiple PDZ domain protein-like n=1 Tax=Oratosquilla oratoria TaxID=337810 RepID=UPI003F776A81
MPIRTDTSEALSLLERIQRAMKETDDIKMSAQCSNDLNTLIAVLESPVFRGIMNIQESLKELRRQVTQHPSIVPADFDITREGKLVMHISPDGAATARDPEGDRREGEGGGAGDKDEKEEEEEEEHLVSKAKETTLEVKEGPPQLLQAGAAEAPSELSPAALITEVQSGASLDIKDDVVKLESQVGLDGTLESEGVTLESDDVPKAITNVTLDQELQRAVQAAAQGREIHHIQMFKPDGSSLGFSVVGLRSEQRGELGIYVQEIQPTGIAAK